MTALHPPNLSGPGGLSKSPDRRPAPIRQAIQPTNSMGWTVSASRMTVTESRTRPTRAKTVHSFESTRPYKLALCFYTQRYISDLANRGSIDQILRMQGPDRGCHTGYEQAGICAGTLENAETTSISIIALNATLPSTVCLIHGLPWWIFCVIGFAGAVAATVVPVVLLGKRRSKPARHSSQYLELNP